MRACVRDVAELILMKRSGIKIAGAEARPIAFFSFSEKNAVGNARIIEKKFAKTVYNTNYEYKIVLF